MNKNMAIHLNSITKAPSIPTTFFHLSSSFFTCLRQKSRKKEDRRFKCGRKLFVHFYMASDLLLPLLYTETNRLSIYELSKPKKIIENSTFHPLFCIIIIIKNIAIVTLETGSLVSFYLL